MQRIYLHPSCVKPLCLLLFALVSLMPVHAAHAQPPDDQLGESAAFLQLFPELRVLPPPTWFQPGARATYEARSAIIGGGGAGAGIVQYDPIASDGLQSLVSVQTFLDNGAGQLVTAGWSFKLAVPAVGEFWIHPLVLPNAEQVANQNLSITRLNKVYAGQNVTVVRFQAELQNGTTVWEFDTASGLLMFYSQITVSGGITSSSQMVFLGFRQMQLPWTAGRAPNWVRNGVVMDYSGQQVTTIPGAQPLFSPASARALLSPTARTWSIDTLTNFINGISTGTAVRATGVGQIFGGMWIPREALAVNVGEDPVVLDTDPITGAVITIQRDNTGAIILRQSGAAHDTLLFYDPVLGSLDRIVVATSSPASLIQTDVVRVGGSDLVELNALPEPPTMFIPLASGSQ